MEKLLNLYNTLSSLILPSMASILQANLLTTDTVQTQEFYNAILNELITLRKFFIKTVG
jgi:hypothetical protein